MKNVLIVAQATNQRYIDVLTKALGSDAHIDIITGSNIKGNIISSPPHDARSLKSRLSCWWKHYRFVNHWRKENYKNSYDLIFANSNPPINSYLLLQLKKQYKAPVVYMNWDLYPQVVELGINNPIAKYISKLWHRWNNANYHKIDRIITIGDVLAETINSRLNKPIKIEVIPLPVDTEELTPVPKDKNTFITSNNLQDKFIVLYSGKMGLGHNIELILEASDLLKSNENIHFVFIGKGQKFGVVESFIKERQCKNVSLYPLQPEDVFPYSMACGDIGIVSQELSMAHLFLPSKTFSMMACGEAIVGICSKHDDLQQLIDSHDIGMTVTDENPKMLADVILHMYENPQKMMEWKKNSRAAIENIYSSEIIEKQYVILFRELFEENNSRG